jgi:hypothetical protein
MFNRYGKARIEIATVIERQGLEAMRMRGTYVIGLTEPPSLEQ